MKTLYILLVVSLLTSRANADDLVVLHKDPQSKTLMAEFVLEDAWVSLNGFLRHTSNPQMRASIAYALANIAIGPDMRNQWVAAGYYDMFLKEDPRRYFPNGWLYGWAYTQYSTLLWNLGRKDESLEILAVAVANVDNTDRAAMAELRRAVDATNMLFLETEEQEELFRELSRDLARR